MCINPASHDSSRNIIETGGGRMREIFSLNRSQCNKQPRTLTLERCVVKHYPYLGWAPQMDGIACCNLNCINSTFIKIIGSKRELSFTFVFSSNTVCVNWPLHHMMLLLGLYKLEISLWACIVTYCVWLSACFCVIVCVCVIESICIVCMFECIVCVLYVYVCMFQIPSVHSVQLTLRGPNTWECTLFW